jgi:hypothetical protein
MSDLKQIKYFGSMFVKDLNQDLVGEVTFIPPAKKGMLSGFFSKPSAPKPAEINKIKIEIKKEGTPISIGRYELIF